MLTANNFFFFFFYGLSIVENIVLIAVYCVKITDEDVRRESLFYYRSFRSISGDRDRNKYITGTCINLKRLIYIHNLK